MDSTEGLPTASLAVEWSVFLEHDPFFLGLLADEQGLIDRYYALPDVVARLEADDQAWAGTILRDALDFICDLFMIDPVEGGSTPPRRTPSMSSIRLVPAEGSKIDSE